MTLPGKLCIGLIEEDNPLKSYFRFRPVVVKDSEGMREFTSQSDFPENGCIRIVPDKNESSRFKMRMRKIGGFCMVDLRMHPEENDKIRPNKNYRGDENESNAYIIYSDVVRELPVGMAAQILPMKAAEDATQIVLSDSVPVSEYVLFMGDDDVNPMLWTHAPTEEVEEAIIYTKTEYVADLSHAQKFETGEGDSAIAFIVSSDETVMWTVPVSEAPAPQEPAPAMPVSEAPAPQVQPVPPVQPVTPTAPVPPMPNMPPMPPVPPAPPAEKPWIHRDPSLLHPPVDIHMPPKDYSFELQRGLNPPRKQQTVQEIIDDKWRHSRFDQLGHPVNGDMHGTPVVTPVDAAVDAVNSAWDHIEARGSLMHALAKVTGFPEAMSSTLTEEERLENERREIEYKEKLNQLKDNISDLETKKDEMTEVIRKEALAGMKADLDAREERVKQLDDETAALRARADETVTIMSATQKSIEELTTEKLERKLTEFALTSRAADILMNLRKDNPARKVIEPLPRVDAAKPAEIAARLQRRLCENGITVSRNEAMNILACFALGKYVMITGCPGCGKTAAVDTLMDEMGLASQARVIPAMNKAKTAPVELEMPSELPLVAMQDDVNTLPRACEDIIGMYDRQNVKIVMTAQDAPLGAPVSPRMLDRCFMLRMSGGDSRSAWSTQPKESEPAEAVITREALENMFAPDEKNVQPIVMKRMARLRTTLERYGIILSRRTLAELWRYCAAVTPYMDMSPLDVFDLAFSQRALPMVIATARLETLRALPEILDGMRISISLLRQPLPIEI